MLALGASGKTTYSAVVPLYVDIAPALLYGTTLGREDVEPLTWATAERARTLSAVDYQVAAFIRQQESRRIAAFPAPEQIDGPAPLARS